jgi:hypothetical protein
MEIIHRCCCGIDVHAKTVVVCLIKNGKKQIRTYSTALVRFGVRRANCNCHYP